MAVSIVFHAYGCCCLYAWALALALAANTAPVSLSRFHSMFSSFCWAVGEEFDASYTLHIRLLLISIIPIEIHCHANAHCTDIHSYHESIEFIRKIILMYSIHDREAPALPSAVCNHKIKRQPSVNYSNRQWPPMYIQHRHTYLTYSYSE